MKSISINLIICMSCVLLSLQSRMKTREENDSQKSLFEALSSEYSKDKNQFDAIAFSQLKESSLKNDKVNQIQSQIDSLTQKAEELSNQLSQMKQSSSRRNLNKVKNEISSLQENFHTQEAVINNQLANHFEQSTLNRKKQLRTNNRLRKNINYTANKVNSLENNFSAQIENFQNVMDTMTVKINDFLREINQKEKVLQDEISLNKKNIDVIKNIMMTKLQSSLSNEDQSQSIEIEKLNQNIRELTNKMNTMSRKYTNLIKKQQNAIENMQNHLRDAGVL